MTKYKNITDQDLTLPEIGEVKAGEVIETEKEINNQNFEIVAEEKTLKNNKSK